MKRKHLLMALLLCGIIIFYFIFHTKIRKATKYSEVDQELQERDVLGSNINIADVSGLWYKSHFSGPNYQLFLNEDLSYKFITEIDGESESGTWSLGKDKNNIVLHPSSKTSSSSFLIVTREGDIVLENALGLMLQRSADYGGVLFNCNDGYVFARCADNKIISYHLLVGDLVNNSDQELLSSPGDGSVAGIHGNISASNGSLYVSSITLSGDENYCSYSDVSTVRNSYVAFDFISSSRLYAQDGYGLKFNEVEDVQNSSAHCNIDEDYFGLSFSHYGIPDSEYRAYVCVYKNNSKIAKSIIDFYVDGTFAYNSGENIIPRHDFVYETKNFYITINSKCVEGVVVCDDIRYKGIRKSDNGILNLIGSTDHLYREGVPTRFLGYSFDNGEYTYVIEEGADLFVIKKGDLVISSDKLILVDELPTFTSYELSKVKLDEESSMVFLDGGLKEVRDKVNKNILDFFGEVEGSIDDLERLKTSRYIGHIDMGANISYPYLHVSAWYETYTAYFSNHSFSNTYDLRTGRRITLSDVIRVSALGEINDLANNQAENLLNTSIKKKETDLAKAVSEADIEYYQKQKELYESCDLKTSYYRYFSVSGRGLDYPLDGCGPVATRNIDEFYNVGSTLALSYFSNHLTEYGKEFYNVMSPDGNE